MDNKGKISIAIDGAAGVGKSTVAKLLAQKLGILYLDTGAMYRAVAWKACANNVDFTDEESLENVANNINIKMCYVDSEQQLILDGEVLGDEIRTPHISIAASNIATIPLVRKKMTELQQQIALKNSVVMEGRDIGTTVLPNAKFKFFLEADIEERAKRRYLQDVELKRKEIVSLEQIKKDIEYRDQNDKTRKVSPLAKASDAIEIDTTNMSISEVIDFILSKIVNESISCSNN